MKPLRRRSGAAIYFIVLVRKNCEKISTMMVMDQTTKCLRTLALWKPGHPMPTIDHCYGVGGVCELCGLKKPLEDGIDSYDALRFIQRVLEGKAQEDDKRSALLLVKALRNRLHCGMRCN